MENQRDLQLALEAKYNKNQLVKRIRVEFENCKEFDFAAHFEELGINPDFGLQVLTQIAIHKQANMSTMIGCVRNYADTFQEAADWLHDMAAADLINWDPAKEVFVVEIDITKDVQHEIDTYQFPLPMVVRPRKLHENIDSAYLSGKQSLILKNNHHDGDICLDHLNRMNRIALSVDVEVSQQLKNKWKGVDKQKDDETRAEFMKRARAFNKYNETAHEVIEIMEKAGNKFYLTHKVDKRGRTYAQGHHINTQGNSWNKATVMFYHGEIVE
jgi:hypothetical protein